MILGCCTIHGFAGSDSIRVVSIADTVTAMRNCGQPPAVLPGEGKLLFRSSEICKI
jgi:hypothetical protein